VEPEVGQQSQRFEAAQADLAGPLVAEQQPGDLVGGQDLVVVEQAQQGQVTVGQVWVDGQQAR
jgi:hypothetical protein